MAAAAALVLVALLLTACGRSRTAESKLAEAASLLDSAETDLLVVDEAIQKDIASKDATQSAEAIELAAGVLTTVEEAAALIREAIPDLPEEKAALGAALKESAEARIEMMEAAPVILEADRQAAIAIPLADQAVTAIKEAETLSASAVGEFNKHTAEGVTASDALSVQADAKLQSAKSLLATATAEFAGADYAQFNAFIDAKLGLIALAKEIDTLWLGGDVAGSNTKLQTYNQRDAEIVAMAAALPASVRDPIAAAYNAATADASKRYFDARERARTAGERVGELSAGE